MQIGKLQESILDRSVFKQLHRNNKDILCKLKAGNGYQLLHMRGRDCLATTTNVVEGSPAAVGELAVPRALNSLICSGAEPVGIMLALVLPPDVAESDFRQMIHRIDALCAENGMEIMGGHTQISAAVTKVIATVTAYGVGGAADCRPRPGQDIVMTKWAGLSGTWLLEKEYHDAFVNKYNPDMADTIGRMNGYFSVLKEARLALDYGARTLYDLSEGGVFGGLWEVAAAGNVGLQVDLKKIPLKQETVELCDFVDVNPYQLISMGSLLIAADHGDQLVRRLGEQGIAAAVIGSFTDSNDRVIVNDDEVRYLEPPRAEKVV